MLSADIYCVNECVTPDGNALSLAGLPHHRMSVHTLPGDIGTVFVLCKREL